METIFKRTSIRQYLDQPVEDEKITRLLQAAMASPSAGNQQPREFFVVRNKQIIQQLTTCSPFARCLANAPLAIVPCYRSSGLRHPDYAQIDMSACTENLLLEAVELGLGAVWLGIAPLQERMDAVSKVLDTGTLIPFAIIAVGYPQEEKSQQNRYDPTRIHMID